MTEKIKLALALLFVAAGLGAFYYLADQVMILRVLAVLASVVVALAIVLTTASGKAALAFSREALAEARKVVWPTRKETIQTTAAVFALVIVMGLFLWVVDVALLWAVKVLMGRSA
jgi:preprotein translocase subunit SecE